MRQEECWEDMLLRLLGGEKRIMKSIGLFRILGPINGEKMDTLRLLSVSAELTQVPFQLCLLCDKLILFYLNIYYGRNLC